jgi:hypothetical protein
MDIYSQKLPAFLIRHAPLINQKPLTYSPLVGEVIIRPTMRAVPGPGQLHHAKPAAWCTPHSEPKIIEWNTIRLTYGFRNKRLMTFQKLSRQSVKGFLIQLISMLWNAFKKEGIKFGNMIFTFSGGMATICFGYANTIAPYIGRSIFRLQSHSLINRQLRSN